MRQAFASASSPDVVDFVVANALNLMNLQGFVVPRHQQSGQWGRASQIQINPMNVFACNLIFCQTNSQIRSSVFHSKSLRHGAELLVVSVAHALHSIDKNAKE